jgi:hypothetical protein
VDKARPAVLLSGIDRRWVVDVQAPGGGRLVESRNERRNDRLGYGLNRGAL